MKWEMDGDERAGRRDEVLAVVAHELLVPVTTVAGWARLLQVVDLGSEQARGAIDNILRASAWQARMVDDLLDHARLAHGELRLERERVELVELATQAADAMRPQAREHDIALHVWSSDPAPVDGDAGRLRQVLCNLLGNAFRYSPRGARVDLIVEHAGDEVVVRVRDTGSGIAPSFLPHVFDRFRREGRSKARGLGLGLAISREIVELHGGTIAADSAGEGHGATFTIRLPRWRDAEGAVREAAG